LRDEWNELLQASASNCLFLTWEWLFTWWKHFSEDRRLHLVTVRCDGELIAIAPLALRPSRFRRLLPFSALEFLGMGSVGSDYLDIPIRQGKEKIALDALAEYLADHKFVMELSRVNRGTAQASALASELKQFGWAAVDAPVESCPFIDLSGHSWESYLASLGREHRYNVRRRLRNLAKQWRVRFDRVESERQRSEAMRQLTALHYLRWRERGSPGVFNSSALVAFHEELSRLALERGWLRLYVLSLDEEAAAAWYGFHYHGAFYFYQAGFDPRLSRHSVGLVAMGLAIKSAIEEGARVYDFLHGDERYKFLWARQEIQLTRWELSPPSARGALYRHMMELRWNIKKAFWSRLVSAS